MDTLGNGLLGACFLLLITAVAPCCADDLEISGAASCAGDCDKASFINEYWQPGSSYPTNLVPRASAADKLAPTTNTPATIMDWHPPDTHWYAKLRGMRELRLLTLWKSEGARVFLGVSDRGVPGIALSSRRMSRTNLGNRRDDSWDWRRYQDSGIYY